MKSQRAQSATSLPRAPRDEASARFVKYAITMSIRTACFILMAVVQPFGWWTWAFAAGAIFLPYVAVVLANIGPDDRTPTALPPERRIENPSPPDTPVEQPGILRISETPRGDRESSRNERPTAEPPPEDGEQR